MTRRQIRTTPSSNTSMFIDIECEADLVWLWLMNATGYGTGERWSGILSFVLVFAVVRKPVHVIGNFLRIRDKELAMKKIHDLAYLLEIHSKGHFIEIEKGNPEQRTKMEGIVVQLWLQSIERAIERRIEEYWWASENWDKESLKCIENLKGRTNWAFKLANIWSINHWTTKSQRGIPNHLIAPLRPCILSFHQGRTRVIDQVRKLPRV